jgi:hypothetical protein
MKFRKKPVVIEAVQWTGENVTECMNFCPPLLTETYRANGTLSIPTLEGKMVATKGDWIIKGVKGEFYPCKPDIFAATYEEA